MTQLLKVDPLKITFEGIHARVPQSKTFENLRVAVETLKREEVVAFPTETVYGLGASCQSTKAINSIYRAKNRPADNPLIIHVASRHQLENTLLKHGREPKIPTIYLPLIDKLWPGPLTILLPLPENHTISPVCIMGQSTFGVRIPQHPVARALIDFSNLPLAAPSANVSTRPSCTQALHVLEDMEGRIPLILDGGAANVGVESTVVDGLVDPPQILRPGGVSLEQIKAIGGPAWANVVVAKPLAADHETVRTPGMKYRHYSPKAKVIVFEPGSAFKARDVVQQASVKHVALLGIKDLIPDLLEGLHVTVHDLPLGDSNQLVSRNLFSRFREADVLKVDLILVEGVTLEDEGLAIMNRAVKAASEVIKAS